MHTVANQFTIKGKIMLYAREIYKGMGYIRWENFNNLIEKAIQLINNGVEIGFINRVSKFVTIGSGAKRSVIDYELDLEAINLLERISSHKLNKSIRIRNETIILTMIKKYCDLKGIPFSFQFRINKFIYDCCINNNILLEFDEHHHDRDGRQKLVDINKNSIAQSNNYKLIRFNVSHDIIDIIVELDKQI